MSAGNSSSTVALKHPRGKWLEEEVALIMAAGFQTAYRTNSSGAIYIVGSPTKEHLAAVLGFDDFTMEKTLV